MNTFNTKFGPDLLNDKGTFTVPIDIDHAIQDYFGVENQNLKATNDLIPAKTYKIKLFPVLKAVESQDCLALLKLNNAIFVGALGLIVLQTTEPNIFPISKVMVSFDEKEALWKDAKGYHGVPIVDRYSSTDWLFGFARFEYSWDSDDILICFSGLD